jgi:hypothetical protein
MMEVILISRLPSKNYFKFSDSVKVLIIRAFFVLAPQVAAKKIHQKEKIFA